jgi:uncharacterized membrane protein YkvA (DUF1232 family)
VSSPGARRPPDSRALWTALRRARRRGSPRTTTLLRALPRLVSATLSGQYKGLSRSRLGLVTLAAAYVASPVDVLPEAVLGPLGVADDAAVLAWLTGTVLTEAEAFLAWERAGRPASGRAPARPDDRPRGPASPTSSRAGWPGFHRPEAGSTQGPASRAGSRSGPDDPDDPDVVVGEVIR